MPDPSTINRLPQGKEKQPPGAPSSTNGCNGHAPSAAAGRDSADRFTKGNKGGPGNPFARQVAALRSALLSAITPDLASDHGLGLAAEQLDLQLVPKIRSLGFGLKCSGLFQGLRSLSRMA